MYNCLVLKIFSVPPSLSMCGCAFAGVYRHTSRYLHQSCRSALDVVAQDPVHFVS